MRRNINLHTLDGPEASWYKNQKKNPIIFLSPILAGLCSAVSSASDCRSKRRESQPKLGHFTLSEIDHEIISTTYGHSPLSLKQEGKMLSVTCKSMCTLYRLPLTLIGRLSLPSDLTDRLDMALIMAVK